jgi:hypothetical protein
MLDPVGDGWTTVSTELRLPPDASFLMVRLHMADLQSRNAADAVEFAGNFADDVRVTLASRPPLPKAKQNDQISLRSSDDLRPENMVRVDGSRVLRLCATT